MFSGAIVLLLWFAVTPALASDITPGTFHKECTVCHLISDGTDAAKPGLKAPEPSLCLECHSNHKAGAGEHVMGVPQPGYDGPLPLPGGVITCSTCHAPHSPDSGQLRLAAKFLCLECH